MNQIEIDFTPGLTEQFPDFGTCLKASVYDCGKPFKAVAADMDMSSSKLSRMLNEADEGIHFPACRLDELISVTGDHRPIHWLIEKYLNDSGRRRKEAINTLIKLMPEIQRALQVTNQNQ
jgi:hypothetical protein